MASATNISAPLAKSKPAAASRRQPVLQLPRHHFDAAFAHHLGGWRIAQAVGDEANRPGTALANVEEVIVHFAKLAAQAALAVALNRGVGGCFLALAGLFELMMKHNLDYPNFFPKLYALFDRNLMHVRYRARFFRLGGWWSSSSAPRWPSRRSGCTA